MSVYKITKEFLEETGVDLFKAIENEGILLGMGFISDEMELADKLLHEFGYLEKIDKLKEVYISRRENKITSMNVKEIIKAIKVSIKNSFISFKTSKRECIYSDLLLSNSRATSILSKYKSNTNPLIYKITETPNAYIKSVINGNIIGLEPYRVANGENLKGDKTYRIKHYLATSGTYRLNSVMDIDKSIYHPIVWYLLEQGALDKYLTPEVIQELEKYILELSIEQIKKLSNLTSK